MTGKYATILSNYCMVRLGLRAEKRIRILETPPKVAHPSLNILSVATIVRKIAKHLFKKTQERELNFSPLVQTFGLCRDSNHKIVHMVGLLCLLINILLELGDGSELNVISQERKSFVGLDPRSISPEICFQQVSQILLGSLQAGICFPPLIGCYQVAFPLTMTADS